MYRHWTSQIMKFKVRRKLATSTKFTNFIKVCTSLYLLLYICGEIILEAISMTICIKWKNPYLVRSFQFRFFETQPDESSNGCSIKCPGSKIEIVDQRTEVGRFRNQHNPRNDTLQMEKEFYHGCLFLKNSEIFSFYIFSVSYTHLTLPTIYSV